MLLLGRTLVLVFVLVLRFCFEEYFGRAQTSLRGQVTNVADEQPGFLIAHNSFPTGHVAEPDAIVDDPLQLAISIFLHPG